MTQTKIQLNPCKECGCQDLKVSFYYGTSAQKRWYVHCNNCARETKMVHDRDDQATGAWNNENPSKQT